MPPNSPAMSITRTVAQPVGHPVIAQRRQSGQRVPEGLVEAEIGGEAGGLVTIGPLRPPIAEHQSGELLQVRTPLLDLHRVHPVGVVHPDHVPAEAGREGESLATEHLDVAVVLLSRVDPVGAQGVVDGDRDGGRCADGWFTSLVGTDPTGRWATLRNRLRRSVIHRTLCGRLVAVSDRRPTCASVIHKLSTPS